ERPQLSFNPDYSQGFNLILPQISRLRGGAQLLSGAAILDLHEGRYGNAWTNIDTLAALVAKGSTEALLISEMIRIAIGNFAITATWEALQAPELNEHQMKQVQKTWESVDVMAQAWLALGMERPMFTGALAEAREGYGVILGRGTPVNPAGSGLAELAQLSKDVLGNPSEGLKAMIHRYPAYWHWKFWESYE